MRNRLAIFLLPLLLLGLLLALYLRRGAGAYEPAEIIYTGGDIITVNDAMPQVEALAVKNGKILAVGSKAEVLKTKGSATRMVDLGGRTLLPGFLDAHGHLSMVGLQAASANMLPAPDGTGNSVAALQRLLKDWASENPEGLAGSGWIIGFGYDDSQLEEKRHPTREDLDEVSTEKPVLIIHQSSHVGVVNSKALEMLGYTAATTDPAGGVIRRKEGSQEPNGVLEEMAFFQAAFKMMGGFDEKARQAMVQQGLKLYASFGFTTAQEGRAAPDQVAIHASLAEKGELMLDVVAYVDVQQAPMSIRPPWLSRDYKGRFRIGGAKLSLDGSPQAKTAWLTQPYYVPPAGRDASYVGYPAISNEAEVMAIIEKCYANHWQLICHCNGDAAGDQMLRGVRAAVDKHGKDDRRTVMIHAQTVREDQLDLMKELDVTPSFFGMHTFYWGDWHRDSVLGPERAARISPAASALRRGFAYTQHHDAPVALPSSVMILHTQVNRVTRSGQILGGDQRVSVMDAIKSITIHAARQYFEEGSKGSLEPGKLADLMIFDKNPLKVDPMSLKDLKVMETIKEGKTVYTRPD